MRTCWLPIAVLALMICAFASAEPTKDVTIDHPDAKVETRHFDPKHPPIDMPALQPGEAAVTVSQFNCEAQMNVTVLEPRDASSHTGKCHAKVRVDSVRVTVGCTITIWLPTNATEKLIAHENGHRKISETSYKDSDAIARKIAEKYVGKTRTGDGATCEAAAQATMQDALNEINGQYMSAVEAPSQDIQNAYDDITDHGRNKVDEDDAINRAMRATQK